MRDMVVAFREIAHGPERLVCEAEIVFGEGPLDGMKLVGFSLWKSPEGEGEIYVTFPSRAFGAGNERRYFDYLRAVDGGGTSEGKALIQKVKQWIIEAYRAKEGA